MSTKTEEPKTDEEGQTTIEGDAEDEKTEEPAEETTPAAADKSSREYIVLEERGATGTWVETKRVVASSPEEALLSLEGELKQGVRYAVPPSRFWRPGKPRIKTVTTVDIDWD